jgi:hypothetical protein
MIGSAVEFPDLVDKIRDKFGLRKRFKIRVRDDDMPNGDMITMGDQDDLDMAIMSVKSTARRERLDMGKMEESFLHPFLGESSNEKIGLDTRSLIGKRITTLMNLKALFGNRFSNLHCINIYQRAIYALTRGEWSTVLDFYIICTTRL